jgi:osmotically inducible protein OsmC
MFHQPPITNHQSPTTKQFRSTFVMSVDKIKLNLNEFVTRHASLVTKQLIMSIHKSSATWKGNLAKGSGTMNVGLGAWEGSYTAKSRFEGGEGRSPEELIAAAHAGCFSMAFSHALATSGYEPQKVETSAEATLEKTAEGFKITRMHLVTRGMVPGITEEKFLEIAKDAKENCPVSKALKGGMEITLDAGLEA